MSRAIVWLRQDLRLHDNPALFHACAEHDDVVPVYILDDETPGKWKLGGAQRWWLHHSLSALSKSFEKHGMRMILRRGNAEALIPELMREARADTVYWNRCYEPFAQARDTAIKSKVNAKSFNGSLLFEPWTIENKEGRPFKVFTPFWKACLASPAPRNASGIPKWKKSSLTLASDRLEEWQLLPTQPDWSGGLRETWQPGEEGAAERFHQFLEHRLLHYSDKRDVPAAEAISKLSPHLHFGEISIHAVWEAMHHATRTNPRLEKPAQKFLSELGWREFSHHLLYHFPHLPEAPFNPSYTAFPWEENQAHLRAWQRGKTGYPLVDAGMRELWHTGFMHNRVRMIVASFLTKGLLLPWQEGEAWFWDTLVDADLANNAASWQWVAGCGADAAPYFRIFNPILQGKRYDPDGTYIRRWVPELASLSTKEIHEPWQSAPHYPRPLIDHAASREQALKRYKETVKAIR